MSRRPTLVSKPAPLLNPEDSGLIQGAAKSTIALLATSGELAYGLRACAEAGRGGLVATLTLPFSVSEIASLRASDVGMCSWNTLAEAAAILDRHRVKRVLIASIFGRSAIEITRLVQYIDLHPVARSAVTSGQLTPAHVRSLASVPQSEQPRWVSQAITHKWSSRQFEAALRGLVAESQVRQEPDANMASYERQLSESLGTNVEVLWPESPAKRRLAVEWYGVEDLKGILSKLSVGPEQARGARPVRRRLIIEVRDSAELSSLTDHLVVPQ